MRPGEICFASFPFGDLYGQVFWKADATPCGRESTWITDLEIRVQERPVRHRFAIQGQAEGRASLFQ